MILARADSFKEKFEFLGLWLDERGDAQVVLRDLTAKGLLNVLIMHPSKVALIDTHYDEEE